MLDSSEGFATRRFHDKAQRTKHKVQNQRSSDLTELFQKPHIVLKEEAYVVELVYAGAGTIDPETESEAGEFFGIYLHGAQNIRVDHARTTELNPSRPLANTATLAATVEAAVVNFGAGLSKRKIRRPEARPGF